MLADDHDAFWDELLSFVEARSVVPIIGPKFALVEHEGQQVPYQDLLARALAQRLRLSDEIGPAPGLFDVARAWLVKPGNKRQTLYRELGDVAAKLPVGIPEALRHLARITDLELFISFCPDELLKKALDEERYGGKPTAGEIVFSLTESPDLAADGGEGSLIYYLFGRYSVLPKYVLAEEDILEWVAALQIPGRRPERLFDRLGKSNLLFLGCDFPDWLARFLLRIAKNDKLSAPRDFTEYMVGGHGDTKDPFVAFIHSFSSGTQILSLNPEAFVIELERRWKERRTQGGQLQQTDAAPVPDSAPPGSVFISYASEDREAALTIASALQSEGLPVWFDRDKLEWGSDYAERIGTAIRRCALFVPVLSRTAEGGLGFYRKEWAQALERNLEFAGSSMRFLCPIVIDDAPVFTSSDIPAAFRALHIENAPAGQTTEQQRKAIGAAFNEIRARLEKRA